MAFKDIKGQDEAVNFLKTAIKNGNIPHAYIFAGPRGCGRSFLARNFAKALNCTDPKEIPCDSCASCNKIDKGTHPDVMWIEKNWDKSEISIRQIRELESQIALTPYEGKCKVCIIIDAELMTVEASNSFLKTLEEPPANSLLILIAEKPKDLLPTILSRCQVVRLKPLARNELASILMATYGIPKEKAELISRFSEGRLGKAISYEDDMLLWKNTVLEEFSDDECIEDYSMSDRDELSKKLNVLASWYRDLLVFKSTNDRSLVINCDRLDDIARRAVTYKTYELVRILDSVLDTRGKIEDNVNPKLALSVMFRVISEK